MGSAFLLDVVRSPAARVLVFIKAPHDSGVCWKRLKALCWLEKVLGTSFKLEAGRSELTLKLPAIRLHYSPYPLPLQLLLSLLATVCEYTQLDSAANNSQLREAACLLLTFWLPCLACGAPY